MVSWFIASTAGHRRFDCMVEALKTATTLRKLGHRVTVGGYASANGRELPLSDRY